MTRTLKQSGGGVFTVRVVHGHMLKAAGGGGGGVRRLRVCVCVPGEVFVLRRARTLAAVRVLVHV